MKHLTTVPLVGQSLSQKRDELKNYLLESFRLEEELFSLLKDDSSFYQRPEPLRHPLIFYYGHTACFYINKLFGFQFIPDRIHASFESIFAIGVDEMSWDDLNEDHYDWPPVSDVKEYREAVKNRVLKYIESMDFTLPIDFSSPAWPVLMGMEHHRIHLETSSVLIRQLSLDDITCNDLWKPCENVGPAPENQFLPVNGGVVSLGKREEHPLYGWDNEYGHFESKQKDFLASKYLVSNQEYKAFVDDDGYQNRQFWSDEGWQWKSFKKMKHPCFWVIHNQTHFLRTLDREIPMPWNWPVEVNYLEAKAFCEWKSQKEKKKIRLPSEAEWTLLRQQGVKTDCHMWEQAPGNIHLEHYHSPCPVSQFKMGDFYDVMGNVWQWTETPIHPFEKFEVHPIYDDFSVPTFDGKHNLMKGGSWISTGNEATLNSRYAFRRHFFQHVGFRYVESPNSLSHEEHQNPYESDTLISKYCEFHYGTDYFQVPNFLKTCIEHLIPYLPYKRVKALDLGCSVGRASLEMAQFFDEVIGMDFSARFIDVAQSFLKTGHLKYALCREGELVDFYERSINDLGLQNWTHKIHFVQGDACNLKDIYTNFDLIFCGNLIDRLNSPKNFLENIHERISPNGILVITSPYTWLEQFTPKEKWLGGYRVGDKELDTLSEIRKILSPHFDLQASPVDIPFVLRETSRRFQHTVSQMTIWRKHNDTQKD